MKIKFNIPETLADVSLQDYQKYLKIAEKEKDNTDFLDLKSVEIFCSLKINDLRAIQAKDYDEILNDLSVAFESKTPFKQHFSLNGVKYGFIPDLENISLGEYIDLETYLQDVESYHKAMAVMYRPVTFEKNETYLIEEYETADKYAAQMKKAPLDIYLGSQVFFYNLGRELAKHILLSSDNPEGMDLELMKILEENGVGTVAFMHLLEGNFGDSMLSLN